MIDAAERVFFSKGYEQSTMDDVAAEAEFSKRTIYLYFNSKEQIYFEIMIRGYKRLIEEIDETMKNVEDHPAVGKLRVMYETIYDFSLKSPAYFMAIMGYENGERDFHQEIKDETRDECYALGERLFGMVTGIIREGVQRGEFRKGLDEVKTALVLWSSMVGVFTIAKKKEKYLLYQHHTSPKELVENSFQLFMQSLTEIGGDMQ